MKFKTHNGEFGVLTKKGVRQYPGAPRRKSAASSPSALTSSEIDPIRSTRGLFAGSNLTAALLASRAEERRRG
jgi:hypothetical protein